VDGRIDVGRKPEGVTVKSGKVWVVNSGSDSVTAIDAARKRVLRARIPIGKVPRDIASSARAVVVTDRDGLIHRIDPIAMEERPPPIAVGGVLRGLEVDSGAIWVAHAQDGTVVQIDPSGRSDPGDGIPTGERPTGLDVDGQTIWVANQGGTLTKIDAKRRREVESFDVGKHPVGVAVGADAVWVTNNGSDSVTRVEP
jgi:serine/threonine-protein kinase